MNELLNKEEESSDKVDMFDDPEVEAEKEEINDNKNSTIVYSGINSNISNISKIDYKKIRSKIDLHILWIILTAYMKELNDLST